MFEKIDTNVKMTELARQIREGWVSDGIIEKAFSRKGEKDFIFLEGPPTANGRPHVGHLETRTFKDVVLRYMAMSGRNIVGRSGGWDCHGLPVEIETEKRLGFNTKKEIVQYGLEKFNKMCQESVFRYIDEWKQCDLDVGFWVDHSNDYVTLRDEYIESEWWVLSQLFSRKILYKDFKIVPYCPRCETSLSSHEVAQGYKEVSDPSVYVRFKVKNKENRYFLVWTTTPWTLPSNQFLAVSLKVRYVLAEHDGEELYLAKSLASELLDPADTILDEMDGNELLGMEYEQLIPFLDAGEGTFKVVSGGFVSTEEGTGIVHISPAFGADDFDIGKEQNSILLNPVDQQGRFDSEKLPWHGMKVKEADPEITKYLKDRNSLYRSTRIKHTYPFCYRCKTPLLYYPMDAWFLSISQFRKELMENNSKVNWIPEYLKNGRFGNFLEEAKDWSLSRNRFWGTPLPLWACPNGHFTAISSKKELEDKSGIHVENLHRPYVDDAKFSCDQCGEEMVREPNVIDTWFDSGSAIYAAKHYPFSGADVENQLPVDFISEGIDQTRGWFYSMHVISSLLFGKNAYNNVLTVEFVLDEKGKKMSKSEGNSEYASDALAELGPDTLRLFFLSGTAWKTKNFDRKVMAELTRRNLNTLLNVYSFFSSNANLDKFEYRGLPILQNPLDSWIISRLNHTIARVKSAFEVYKPHECFAEMQDFIDDLSNSYLRLSRRRFWTEEGDMDDKNSAYSVLYHCLLTLSKAMAPITPFFSEFLYKHLHGKQESVHFESFPSVDNALIREDLEEEFKTANLLLERARKLRQSLSIKGRQPVSEILVLAKKPISDSVMSLIIPELNSKELRFIKNNERPVSHEINLDFKKAAPVFREEVNAVSSQLKDLPAESVVESVRSLKAIVVSGKQVPPEFIVIKENPDENYGMEKDERTGLEIFINSVIDRDLLLEGLSREVIRRIQVMRKDMDLNYDDHVSLKISADAELKEAIEEFMETIKKETLADSLSFQESGDSESWDVDGMKLKISVTKL